jgi:hypothetical protein
MLACFAYLAVSISGLLFPAYEDKVWRFAQPVLLAEVAFMVWLAIVGVKEKPVVITAV